MVNKGPNKPMDVVMLSQKIGERVKQKELAQYAENLADRYARANNAEARKLKGQFFTPRQVSMYMSNLFEIHHDMIRLLDPGAGTGILTAAFCERLLQSDRTVKLMVDAYENDRNLSPLLKEVLETCKSALEGRGHIVDYHIYEQDFILSNERYFKKSDLFSTAAEHTFYDFVISNPPYYKLNKDSPQSTVMAGLVSGQPNIYALFMALSTALLKPEGEMVFITPRSFCSGLYYKKFREWFLKNVELTNIHTFESRKEIFDKDEVLQENVIVKARKRTSTREQDKVIITISKNKHFEKLTTIEVSSADVVHHRNGEIFIRIPTSPFDVDVLHIVDKWPNTLRDWGLEVSTGPVVPFRATQYLLPNLTQSPESVPLLWMHNMQGIRVTWPLVKNNKPSAIRLCKQTLPLLVPVKNYILVKRFSSKEQKRRLHATVLLQSDFPYESIGIENHVNYIYRPRGSLSVYEAFGIAALLDTTIVDNYFRSLNGNTQVNAIDIRSLPLPKIEDIEKVGVAVHKSGSCRKGFFDLEVVVNKGLGIKTP